MRSSIVINGLNAKIGVQVVLKWYKYSVIVKNGFNKWKYMCIEQINLNITDVNVNKCVMTKYIKLNGGMVHIKQIYNHK